VRSPAFLHWAGQTSAVFLDRYRLASSLRINSSMLRPRAKRSEILCDRIVHGQFEIGNRLTQLQARGDFLHQSPLSSFQEN